MILVTGATGFIGRHLMKGLINKYGKDNILALTSRPIEGCAYLLHRDYTFQQGFFVNAGFSKIDTIIHAGAFIPKQAAEVNDLLSCNRNIFNTSVLLNAEFPQLNKFIFISTVDVYGTNDLISEESIPDPVSLYGHSKLYCEKMVGAWANNSGVTCQILRLGHVYGAGEEAYQKIIPITFRRLRNREEISLWGSGDELRSFIYVDDVVTAILNSLALQRSIGVVNIAGSERISINDLLNKLILISGINSEIVRVPHETSGRHLIFDNSKMKKYLLEKETPMNEGLMAEWRCMQDLK